MPELLLHYIWQNSIWNSFPQMTTEGEPIRIHSVGQHNLNAGPDYAHAHITIGEQEWVGNVEIHINASDWYKHKHHLNPAYDSVILHVVCHADKEVYNSKGERITQCVLNYPKQQDYLTQLLQQTKTIDTIYSVVKCSNLLLKHPDCITQGWRQTLMKIRLEKKTESIQRLLKITQNNWEEAFYLSLTRNFGFSINSLPFELLAIQTPLTFLRKHRNSLFQLTAMLLGQTGLLNDKQSLTEEQKRLYKEYLFLQKKFNLVPIDPSLWKYSRTRPYNFPEVRVRQLAHLIYQSEFLFSQLMEPQDLNKLYKLLQIRIDEPSVYEQISQPMMMSKNTIELLLINTVIPYQYTYNTERHQQDIQTIYALLQAIAPENNTIIRQWKSIGQNVASALDSQALLHLYMNYCQSSDCINCDVAYQIFQINQPNQPLTC